MFKEKGIFVITFDDVLVHSSYNLYTYLCRNYTFYSKYLNLYKLYTKKEIYERNNQDLIHFLFNTESFNRLSDKAKIAAMSNLYSILYADYYEHDIVNNMTETNISIKFLKNPLLFENSGIDKIYILVKYHTEHELNYKVKFIKTVYVSDKIEIIPIKYNKQYYSIIDKRIKRWDMLITDDAETIEYLATKDMDHREIVMPKYGYNTIKPEIIELIKQKSGTLSFYEIED